MNAQKFAYLLNQLQAPIIVDDILRGQEALTDEAHYALSDMLSEFTPVAATMAIAQSLVHISAPYLEASPGMQVAHTVCQSMVQDYGPAFIDQSLSSEDNAACAHDTFSSVIDDLEHLDELLSLVTAFLQSKDPVSLKICSLLKASAISHRLIAETVIDQLESDGASDLTALSSQRARNSGNIISFVAAE